MLIKAEWGLDRDGRFRQNLVYQMVNGGFGGPFVSMDDRALEYRKGDVLELEGVVVPGFVNAHTHLDLSWIDREIDRYPSVFEFAAEMINRKPPPVEEIFARAGEALEKAQNYGTYFFIDTGNTPSLKTHFADQRVLFLDELTGFSQARSRAQSELLADTQKDLPYHFIPHSPYGTSPDLMGAIFGADKHKSITSIHLLEDISEKQLPYEKGGAFDFLQRLGQYHRYPALYQQGLLTYLEKMGLFEYEKILLVHMVGAGTEEFDFLKGVKNRCSIVLCDRSNRFLGYQRSNWDQLVNPSLPLLLGTDSLATTPDLSILHEICAIMDHGVISQEKLFHAATYGAYDYLGLNKRDIPLFQFQVDQPDPKKMIEAGGKKLTFKNES